MPKRTFGLTVITNQSPDTLQVEELRAPAGSGEQAVRPLELAWPRTVFSLSHVALPFPPTIRSTATSPRRSGTTCSSAASRCAARTGC